MNKTKKIGISPLVKIKRSRTIFLLYNILDSPRARFAITQGGCGDCPPTDEGDFDERDFDSTDFLTK